MISVALLRGINVGGKNKVEMARLKQTFERLGLGNVRTYINSGNVIFTSDAQDPSELASVIEDAIEEDFGLRPRVLIRDQEAIEAVERAIPSTWVSDATMRCDVQFLWEEIDDSGIIDDLPVRDGIDEVIYVPGAVIWKVDAGNLTRSGRSRVVGTRTYQSMTVRNSNTVRKLATLMRETAG